ncbi:adenine-specific DNA methyltransferase, partial [Helicobacter pylori]
QTLKHPIKRAKMSR